MLSKKSTRRAVLAGASAVAIPAAASATGTAGGELLAFGVKLETETDAELLALGVKLDEVSAEMNRHDRLAQTHALDGESLVAMMDALNDRLNELCDDILARTAQSPAGLAVQTRAIMLTAAELWAAQEAGPERAFIEAVGRFVGVAPPAAPPNDPTAQHP